MAHDRHDYREECRGCQLALCSGDGRPLADNDPLMVRALAVWWTLSLEERRACNRVWVHNSRAPHDIAVMQSVGVRISAAIEEKHPVQS